MKLKRFIASLMITIISVVYAFSQTNDPSLIVTTKTDTIKVWGNCGMCKARIEKTANINGVSKAEWDNKTMMLTLIYDTLKVTSDDVQKRIAAVGHDTEKFKADDKAYESLPGCCKYR